MVVPVFVVFVVVPVSCYPEGVDDGSKMIFCEADSCAVGWYHFKCVNLKRKPRGKWICNTCLK